MSLTLTSTIPKKEFVLPDGRLLVLLEVLGKTEQFQKEEQNRNVFLVDTAGRLLWRIAYHEGIRGHDPFVGISIREDGEVVGGTWDGWEFAISLEDGTLTKLGWSK